ncbi:(S)-beta-bisabolene synthase [Elysia marginata]|uniref:(S)-beta-bisabolene synthase n=1 Tax=Elysia marginata TaxID=1093978 RepID=A0AAV4JRM6_9GAST|nr:(S)-beta-bisabolene synthase [Elysia marginata]
MTKLGPSRIYQTATTQVETDLSEVDWTFFGTAHGKGPIDGVGGTVKRAVWRRILRRQVVINHAKDFADVAATACPNINVIFVPQEEVAKVRRELDNLWDQAPPLNISQIRQNHYFKKGSKCEILKAAITPYFKGFKDITQKALSSLLLRIQ